MICLRQVLLFFTLLVSIQALDKCPANVQTVDAVDVQKVLFNFFIFPYSHPMFLRSILDFGITPTEILTETR